MSLRQEVQVTLTVTYDADARLSKRALREEIANDIGRLTDADSESKIEATGFVILGVREEAEIYGSERG
jgi:hypothetical protein